jgi:hypothetical protein
MLAHGIFWLQFGLVLVICNSSECFALASYRNVINSIILKFLPHLISLSVPSVLPTRSNKYGSSFAGIAGLNPAGIIAASLSYKCCMLSDRGLCDWLIVLQENSYLVCMFSCVFERHQVQQ